MDPFSAAAGAAAGPKSSSGGDYHIVGQQQQQLQQQKPIEDLLEDEDELEDETLGERFAALAEMFPQFVRTAASATATGSVRLVGWSCRQAGNLAWVVATTGIIAALPLIIERERVGQEEAELAHERKVMLGPAGAAGVGAAGGTAAAAASFAQA